MYIIDMFGNVMITVEIYDNLKVMVKDETT